MHNLQLCVYDSKCLVAMTTNSDPEYGNRSVGLYGTGNGTGNSVHLPSPNPYPTSVLGIPNFGAVYFNWSIVTLSLTHFQL